MAISSLRRWLVHRRHRDGAISGGARRRSGSSDPSLGDDDGLCLGDDDSDYQLYFEDSVILENDLFKEDWRSRKDVQILQYVVLKWALVLLIGLATGLVGFFNNIAVENIAGFKLLPTGGSLDS
ncbi:hypothetical protein L1987_18027 [Smallanthus sonchifolius]|uniref:Uncharacterized protein n=1 Tax=Smallanthus sonchifolius TaxID=185202 RepID=A0ACB9IYZ5_9ASTR|nr:hypothetical protein L1987_18027 [Smallanthus sonchifolius]